MKISLQNNGVAGLKMWEATVTPAGITIAFGSVGKKPRTQTIPLSACENGDAEAEARKRAEAKRKEGYWDVAATSDPSASPSSQPAGRPANTLDAFEKNEWF